MRNHYLIYLLFFLFSQTVKVHALDAPQLRCIQVEANGSVIIKWRHSTDLAGFSKYNYYYSYDGVNFVLLGSVTTNPPDVDSAGHSSADALNRSRIYYFVEAVSVSGEVYSSDTLCTIDFHLSRNPSNSIAILSWDHPVDPLYSSYSSHYDIYRKYPHDIDFVFIGSTPGRSFRDTISICSGRVEYKVVLTDLETNCQNVSRIQGDIFEDKTSPPKPEIDSVSVDFNNGRTYLGWTPSIHPGVFGYIIYVQNEATMWVPVDTIYGLHTTSWNDTERDASFQTYNYIIAAIDSCMNSSALSEYHSTMLTYIVKEECTRNVTVKWTPYVNMKEGLMGYGIYYTVDGGSLQFAGTAPATSSSFVMENVDPNAQYKVTVRAYSANGMISASSATSEFNLDVEDSPHFAYIKSVSVEQNRYISLSILTSGDTLPFTSLVVKRKDHSGGTFYPVASIPYEGMADYHYTDHRVSVHSTVYYYQVEIINECNMTLTRSNTAHNIVLTGEGSEARLNNMQWIQYGDWMNGVSHYAVRRKMQTEDLFTELATIPAGSALSYQDDVSDLFGYGARFVYYIEAKGNSTVYGEGEVSVSNQITLHQFPATYVPNAFNPDGLHNKVFLPVNSFVDTQNYYFTVYSRANQVIFQTRDPYEGWDGTYGGKPAPLGIYIYSISYQQPDGTVYEKAGTVTLLR